MLLQSQDHAAEPDTVCMQNTAGTGCQSQIGRICVWWQACGPSCMGVGPARVAARGTQPQAARQHTSAVRPPLPVAALASVAWRAAALSWPWPWFQYEVGQSITSSLPSSGELPQRVFVLLARRPELSKRCGARRTFVHACTAVFKTGLKLDTST